MGRIRENSLYFPCITGNFMRDEFARDSLHHHIFQRLTINWLCRISPWQPHGNHGVRFRGLYLPPFVGPRSVLALRWISARIWAAPSAFDVRIRLEAHRIFGYNHESNYFSARKVRATRATPLSPPQISKEIRLAGPWTHNRAARCPVCACL